jgi:hypothetical protein
VAGRGFAYISELVEGGGADFNDSQISEVFSSYSYSIQSMVSAVLLLYAAV